MFFNQKTYCYKFLISVVLKICIDCFFAVTFKELNNVNR